jgi:hypothetical protein
MMRVVDRNAGSRPVGGETDRASHDNNRRAWESIGLVGAEVVLLALFIIGVFVEFGRRRNQVEDAA